MDQLELPNGLEPLGNLQVAGHTFQANTIAIGMLRDTNSGRVLKCLGKPECAERELGFYESLQTKSDPVIKELRMLVPRYYRTLPVVVNRQEHLFIELEDLTHGMTQPCIMDIKIGKRTWDPLATPNKIAVEEEKYAKCKNALGLCIPGFQVYPAQGGDVKRYGKEYGKNLDPTQFRNTMALFLNTEPDLCELLLHETLRQLHAIHDWFEKQRIYHFYASSILITYDLLTMQAYKRKNHEAKISNGHEEQDNVTNGNNSSDDSCNSMRSPRHTAALPLAADWIKVKMIDFAHVFPAKDNTKDTNYLHGLLNLINIVESLL